MKMLVNTLGGAQDIITVGEGGGYYDPSLVLWDEGADGELPDITVGGMRREGAMLVFDQAIFDGYLAIRQQEADARHNAWVIKQLEAIDAKSIRSLREGNQTRIAELESDAAALRIQLRK